jgi:pimeloyl-ACP methyl ester carboxylesterase
MTAAVQVDAPREAFDIERFDVPGGAIEARLAGTGVTALFLHGILVNGHVWDPIVPLLRARARLVLPDLPLGGHRLALERDADCSLAAHAERVISIARKLPAPLVLVAGDTGGALAQLAVVRAPELFDRLVLLPSDAFENCPPRLLAPMRLLAHAPVAVTLLAGSLNAEFMMRAMMKLVSRARLDRATLDGLLGDLRSSPAVRHDLVKLLAHLRPEVTSKVAEEIHRFARPVLIAWSARDPLFPLAHGQRLAKLFPNARLEVISDTRAFVSLDQPERLAALIDGFLTSP